MKRFDFLGFSLLIFSLSLSSLCAEPTSKKEASKRSSPSSVISTSSEVSTTYKSFLKRELFSPLKPMASDPVVPEGVFPLSAPEPLEKEMTLLGVLLSQGEEEKKYAIIDNTRTKESDFYTPGAIIKGYRLIDVIEKGAVFEDFLGERFLLTSTGARALGKRVKTLYYRVKIKDALARIEAELPKMKTLSIKETKEGISLLSIPAGTILDGAGLMEGDLLQQIGEKPLTTSKDILSAYDFALESGSEKIVLYLLRNRVPLRIIYILE
ncbi:MAG: hypothetical protein WC049_05445 [Candidatus Ratteibacteria bacterium]